MLRRILASFVSAIALVPRIISTQFLLGALATFVFVILVSGCQEDNTNASLGTTPTNAPPAVRSVLYGYYGSWDYTVLETQDHATLQFVNTWGSTQSFEQAKARLREARAANTPCVMLDMGIAFDEGEEGARAFLDALKADGLIDSRICVLYGYDEPDLNVRDEKSIREGVALVRRLAAEYGFIPNIPVATIYTSRRQWTAIDAFDWVGFDDYGQGSLVLSNEVWLEMKRLLRPDQRVMLVPPAFQCANVWDFYAKAQEDTQVVAILAFIWFDKWDGDKPGLRSLGCRADYINAAMRLKGNS